MWQLKRVEFEHKKAGLIYFMEFQKLHLPQGMLCQLSGPFGDFKALWLLVSVLYFLLECLLEDPTIGTALRNQFISSNFYIWAAWKRHTDDCVPIPLTLPLTRST